ncbi:MAG: histidine kinase [Clostridiaceae bacterium]|nr:histidine kinase [Clostridiaceae bacterium]
MKISFIENMADKLFRNKVRGKLIIYFTLITFIMGATSIYTFDSARMLISKFDAMFMNDIALNELYNDLNSVQVNLESYLSTRHSDSLRDYSKSCVALRENSQKIKDEMMGSESKLLLKDIRNMIETYITEADLAVNAKRARNINDYTNHFLEASKIAKYIELYINKLNMQQLQENTYRYQMISKRISMIQLLNITLIIVMIIINIFLSIQFAYYITNPIIKLSHYADAISRGNFDEQEVVVDSNDEIGIMANAFNRMVASIKSYIEQLKESAQLESKLKEQEMQNLKMRNLLKEAELHALQSQINPHFIFNTLNAGAQIAMFEGADKTCEFMENVANLFRYNVRNIEIPVTILEEVTNINHYIYIIKARFGDKIHFLLELDESVMDVQMPRLILQPIVENSLIHGVGDMEEKAIIRLKTAKKDDIVEITIEDNGKGMDEKTINNIMQSAKQDTTSFVHRSKGNATGIGLNNVISRLKLFFNREDVINIVSSPGKGTKVIIRIPVNKNNEDLEK